MRARSTCVSARILLQRRAYQRSGIGQLGAAACTPFNKSIRRAELRQPLRQPAARLSCARQNRE